MGGLDTFAGEVLSDGIRSLSWITDIVARDMPWARKASLCVTTDLTSPLEKWS